MKIPFVGKLNSENNRKDIYGITYNAPLRGKGFDK